MRWFWFKFNIQNTKAYTIIWNITSALLLTQYAENTYPLTFPSCKSVPSVPRLCCCFFSLHCSRAFIMFLPLAHTIKMCCSDTCISAKVALWGCQNTLSYCHENRPFFFPLKSSLAFWRKDDCNKIYHYRLYFVWEEPNVSYIIAVLKVVFNVIEIKFVIVQFFLQRSNTKIVIYLTLCLLVFCRLDTSSHHLGRRNLNKENASNRLTCRKVCGAHCCNDWCERTSQLCLVPVL